jgi:uncharacterized protein (DUF488 family)
MPKHPPLFTIGYEHATQGAFLDALGEADVGLLVDVRAVAASRRPGFSKRQLAAGVDERGIDYLHLRGLGTPADGRTAARAGRHAEMRRIFEAELETDRAKGEMAELMEIVRSGRRVCLVCYERDPAHCHRSIVAERVCEALGIGVEHLVPVPGI